MSIGRELAEYRKRDERATHRHKVQQHRKRAAERSSTARARIARAVRFARARYAEAMKITAARFSELVQARREERDEERARAVRQCGQKAIRAEKPRSKKARQDRARRLKLAVAACRASVAAVKARTRLAFGRHVAALRVERDAARAFAKAQLDGRKSRIRSGVRRSVVAALEALRDLIEQRRREHRFSRSATERRGGTRKKRPRGEQREEELDAAESDIEATAPHLLPIWRKVRRTMRATPRRTLLETFYDYAHDSGEAVLEELADDAEREGEEMARRHYAAEAKRYEAEAKTTKKPGTAKARERRALLEAAPF